MKPKKEKKIIKGWAIMIKTPKSRNSIWLRNQFGEIYGARIFNTEKLARGLYPSEKEIIYPVEIKIISPKK